jgi:hypothetical protein
MEMQRFSEERRCAWGPERVLANVRCSRQGDIEARFARGLFDALLLNLGVIPQQRVDEETVVPTLGPSDWRRLLADSDRHWKAGYSAYECAVAWEAARDTERGLPAEIV